MQQLTIVARFGLMVFFLVFAIPKFIGQDITVYIFTELGVEPWGRYVTGIIELTVAALLLREATLLFGLVIALCTIVGALLAHFTVIGIVIADSSGAINDEASTFITAIIILVLLILNFFLNRKLIDQQLRRLIPL